jgi:hypothetical protein
LVGNAIRLGRDTTLAEITSNGSQWESTLSDDEALAALLAAAYGRQIEAADAPVHAIKFAVHLLQKGDRAGAADALNALRLGELDEAGASRLAKAEGLIASGLSPQAALAKLVPALAKYSPDQPRVPAGNSDGGQWTAEGSDIRAPDGLDDAVSSTLAVSSPSEIRNSDRVLVADNRDPNVATDGSTSNVPAIPGYKSKFVDPNDWRSFQNALATSDATDTQAFSYGQTFAAEGGMTPNPGNGRVAGFDQAAISKAIEDQQLPKGTTLANLIPAQAATLYARQTNDNFKTVGGADALNVVGDKYAAAALADTLFWQGSGSGAQTVQMAINDAIRNSGSQSSAIAVDGRMGPETLQAYAALAQNSATRDYLLDALAYERVVWGTTQKGPIDIDRIENFRFAKQR